MSNIENEVLKFINTVKKKMHQMNLNPEKVFLNGNCGNLYSLLEKEFSPRHVVIPNLISWEDEPMHLVSEIDGKLYDIMGETNLKKYIEYVREHNNGIFKEEDFTIKQLTDPKEKSYYTSHMRDMYMYNEDYEQSEIENQMHRLERYMADYSLER